MSWFNNGKFKKRKRRQSKSEAVTVTSIADVDPSATAIVADNDAGNNQEADIIETTDGREYTINAKGVWQRQLGTGGGVLAQSDAPANPEIGTLWMDVDDDKFWIFNSTGWVLVSEPRPKFTELRNASGAVITRGAVGSTIVIIGEEFKSGTVVTIGGAIAITTLVDSSSMNLVVPNGTQGTTHDIVITQPSGLQASGEDAFTYNRTPSFSNSGNMGNYNSGSLVTISANATDGDGDGLTYALISGSLPTGTSLNTSTGSIQGSPGSSAAGTFNWTLSVTDGLETDTSSYSATLVPLYKYRHIYAHSFTGMGYKDGSPWKNVNRTDHVNDTTTNLGDRFDRSQGYIDGGWDDTSEILYGHGAGNSNGGSHNWTSSYNMRTDTGLGGSANMTHARGDPGVSVDMARRFGYIGGGGRSDFTKMSYTTNVGVHIGEIAGPSDGTQSTAFFGEHHGWHNNNGAAVQFNFATTTASAWGRSYGQNGCQKALSSKNGYALSGRDGGCGSDSGFDEYSSDTGAFRWNGAKPVPNCGEENMSMGQDKGYCLGQYDGVQNNKSFVWYFASRSGTNGGSAMEPKGHAGMSSGFGCSRKG